MFVFPASVFCHWDKHNLFLMFSALRFAVTATWRQNTEVANWSEAAIHGCISESTLASPCLPEQIAGIGSCSSKWFGRGKKSFQNVSLASIVNILTVACFAQLPPISENYHLSHFHKKMGAGVFLKKAPLWKPFSQFRGLWNDRGLPRPTVHKAASAPSWAETCTHAGDSTFPLAKGESGVWTWKLWGAFATRSFWL